MAKHNFTEKFERNQFKGKSNYPMRDPNTGAILKDAEGNPRYGVRTSGETKASFLERHELNKDSHPSEFVDAFIPLTASGSNRSSAMK